LLPGERLQEVTSASAQTIVDSSATDLLRELNIVKCRIDLFPVVAIVGVFLLLRTIQVQTDWLQIEIDISSVPVEKRNDAKFLELKRRYKLPWTILDGEPLTPSTKPGTKSIFRGLG